MTHVQMLAAIKASLAMSESKTERANAYPIKPKESKGA